MSDNPLIKVNRGTLASIPVLADGELYMTSDTHNLYVGYGGVNYEIGGASNLPDPVTPAHGGTGLTTITAHGVMIGEGTGNVATVSLTALQLLIGATGADPTAGFPDPRSFTKYAARAYYSGAGTNVFTNNTFITVPFDTQDYANGVTVDTTTNKGRFTVPVNGAYILRGQLGMGSMTAGNVVDSRWVKNAGGTPVVLGEFPQFAVVAGTNYAQNVFGPYILAANDTIDFQGFQNSGAAKNSVTGTTLTWATVQLLAAN